MPIGRWLDGGERRERAGKETGISGGKKALKQKVQVDMSGRRKKLDYEIIRVQAGPPVSSRDWSVKSDHSMRSPLLSFPSA